MSKNRELITKRNKNKSKMKIEKTLQSFKVERCKNKYDQRVRDKNTT